MAYNAEEYPGTIYLWTSISCIVLLMAGLVGNAVLIGLSLANFWAIPIDRQHAVRNFSISYFNFKYVV